MKTSRVISRLFMIALVSGTLLACQNQEKQKELAPKPNASVGSSGQKICFPILMGYFIYPNQVYNPRIRSCIPNPSSFCLDPNRGIYDWICIEIPILRVPDIFIDPYGPLKIKEYPILPKEHFQNPVIDAGVVFLVEDYLLVQRISKFEGGTNPDFFELTKPMYLSKEHAEKLQLPGHIIKPGKYPMIPNEKFGMETMIVPKAELGY